MRVSATVLFVACCAVSLAGCCGRGHRHSCLFGDRFDRDRCVDRDKWDRCDDDDFDDDDDGHCNCGCHGGHMMPDYGMPMQSFDSGCGCGGGMSMPAYYGGGMPMSMDSGCGCGAGVMSSPSFPTYSQPMMMNSPVAEPTPTLATPPMAPGAEAYYSPKGTTPPSATSTTVPPRY